MVAMDEGVEKSLRSLRRRGARVDYDPQFLASADADAYLVQVRAALERDPPEELRIRLPYSSRTVPLARRQVAYGEPGTSYRFSGLCVAARPWTEPFVRMRDELRRRTGYAANFVLVNHYRCGADRLSWHADDEADLGPSPDLYSISLGAERDFQLRPKAAFAGDGRRSESVTLPLAHGSLLVMRHPTNRDWKHQVPRRGGRHPEVIGERFNLTWRRIVRS